MAGRNYLEVCFQDSDRSSPDAYYRIEIVVGRIRFIPDIGKSFGNYTRRVKANEAAKRIAASLGIEARLAED